MVLRAYVSNNRETGESSLCFLLNSGQTRFIPSSSPHYEAALEEARRDPRMSDEQALRLIDGIMDTQVFTDHAFRFEHGNLLTADGSAAPDFITQQFLARQEQGTDSDPGYENLMKFYGLVQKIENVRAQKELIRYVEENSPRLDENGRFLGYVSLDRTSIIDGINASDDDIEVEKGSFITFNGGEVLVDSSVGVPVSINPAHISSALNYGESISLNVASMIVVDDEQDPSAFTFSDPMSEYLAEGPPYEGDSLDEVDA